jgi:hypothetical protein
VFLFGIFQPIEKGFSFLEARSCPDGQLNFFEKSRAIKKDLVAEVKGFLVFFRKALFKRYNITLRILFYAFLDSHYC